MHIKKYTTLTFLFTIIALTTGLAGCEKIVNMVPDPDMSTVEAPIIIPIGVIVSQTGKDAEPYGLPMKRGFELALEEINKNNQHEFNFTFSLKDDQSSEEGAIAAVQELVDEGVPVILGIAVSDYLEDAFPIAQRNQVVAFSPVSSAAGLSSIGDYIFRAGLATNILNPNGVTETLKKLNYTKAALIYDTQDTFATSSNQEIKKALNANGIQILTEETFSTGDIDFTPQLTKIMKTKPQVLFVSALSHESTQILIQARKLGIPNTTQFIIPELDRNEIKIAGEAAEGAIIFVGWSKFANTPGNEAFVRNYQQKYGIEPELGAAQSYATLYILADAIAKTEAKDETHAIRDALARTKNLPTILGNFSFDRNGEAIHDTIILKVIDGQLQIFE